MFKPKLYKIVHGLVVIQLPTYIEYPMRLTHHMHSLTYRQIHTTANYYQFSFYPTSIVLWNKLPEDVAQLSDLDSFKQKVNKITHSFPCQKYCFYHDFKFLITVTLSHFFSFTSQPALEQWAASGPLYFPLAETVSGPPTVLQSGNLAAHCNTKYYRPTAGRYCLLRCQMPARELIDIIYFQIEYIFHSRPFIRNWVGPYYKGLTCAMVCVCT